jgi:ubiquitin C-terminal hydrolase
MPCPYSVNFVHNWIKFTKKGMPAKRWTCVNCGKKRSSRKQIR